MVFHTQEVVLFHCSVFPCCTVYKKSIQRISHWYQENLENLPSSKQLSAILSAQRWHVFSVSRASHLVEILSTAGSCPGDAYSTPISSAQTVGLFHPAVSDAIKMWLGPFYKNTSSLLFSKSCIVFCYRCLKTFFPKAEYVFLPFPPKSLTRSQ